MTCRIFIRLILLLLILMCEIRMSVYRVLEEEEEQQQQKNESSFDN
jgi:hypothetical protein